MWSQPRPQIINKTYHDLATHTVINTMLGIMSENGAGLFSKQMASRNNHLSIPTAEERTP